MNHTDTNVTSDEKEPENPRGVTIFDGSKKRYEAHESEFGLYVTTWARYNRGFKGFYVDLEDYADHQDFLEAIKSKLALACNNDGYHDYDPEWVYQNVCGLPDSLVNEDRVNPVVFEWIGLGEDDRDLLTAWADATSAELTDITSDLETAQDNLEGKYDSERAAGELMTDEYLKSSSIKLPDWILLDYEAIWNGTFTHDFSTSNHGGEFWVFHN